MKHKIDGDSRLSVRYGTKVSRRELEEAILLVPSCVSGCARAQSRIYEILYGPMFLYCLKRANGDIFRAQDMAQEAFVKVFQNLGMLSSPGSLHVWVARVFRAEVIDQHRRARTLKQRPNIGVEMVEDGMATVPYDDRFEHEHDFEALVRTFSARQGAIFRLVWQGYDYEDIGAELGLPSGTVKSLVSRERERMRNAHGRRRA